MDHAPIEVEGIYKSYPAGKEKVVALENINFTVSRGELFGLIGPDGAGKTSLFRILTTLLLPDSGNAFVGGNHIVKDYKKIRQIVGYMPGRFSLYQDLTVEENLSFFATLFNTSIDENYDLVKDIYHQIEPFKKRKAGNLSGGMKQKLALSCALIHRPQVLFLDEPTTGVDAVSRSEFWDLLKKLKEQEITILVSTPYMDEASRCDRVALIQEGKILEINSPEGITKNFANNLFALRSGKMFPLLQELKKAAGVVSTYPFGQYHHVVVDKEFEFGRIESSLRAAGYDDLEVKPGTVTIEDCFMELMRK
jgi:ABC-type multidrug transport system ATPase subunit